MASTVAVKTEGKKTKPTYLPLILHFANPPPPPQAADCSWYHSMSLVAQVHKKLCKAIEILNSYLCLLSIFNELYSPIFFYVPEKKWYHLDLFFHIHLTEMWSKFVCLLIFTFQLYLPHQQWWMNSIESLKKSKANSNIAPRVHGFSPVQECMNIKKVWKETM